MRLRTVGELCFKLRLNIDAISITVIATGLDIISYIAKIVPKCCRIGIITLVCTIISTSFHFGLWIVDNINRIIAITSKAIATLYYKLELVNKATGLQE
ncbi:MAG: hypothetical protein QM530_03800 [Phycisphaerales bacterium]|nr:hypothetical protein [Phycisphaerales bacterium]